MDGREGMSASYYFGRGGFGGGSGGTGGGSGVGAQPGAPTQQPGTVMPGYRVENPSLNVSRGGVNVAVGSSSPVATSDQVKKKRGRPRKYAPDGSGTNMSLALSPMSATPSSGAAPTSSEAKRGKGRPRGTGWKQQLAPLGEWMNSSAGVAFTPHVIHIGVGEDVAAKILSFAQQRPRALCIMSGNGSVSAVTLRQPVTSGGTLTYEGRFQILCLSGSYLVAETGGPQNRTGGLSISVCSPDGHVIGGAIGGRLIAAGPVQVVACSFVYGGKIKNKPEASAKEENSSAEPAEEKYATSTSVPSKHEQATPNSVTGAWPPGSRPNSGNSQTDIDLMRG